MKINFGFSPCPNDTFMFEAIVNNRIDTGGLKFDYHLEDVEQLNIWAKEGRLTLTKLSFATFLQVIEEYQLLNVGSALGHNCGPLLITAGTVDIDIEDLCIAIPGYNTTANHLLSFAYPKANTRKEFLFCEIEDKVLAKEMDAGLIIHENRFTYKEKGLKKIIDLGEYWEKQTGSPIPLGGIAVKRELPSDIKLEIETILSKSIEYAFKNPNKGINYIRQHAQEMDEDVMRSHIDLYVNEYSRNIGVKGKEAIRVLAQQYFGRTISDIEIEDYFV